MSLAVARFMQYAGALLGIHLEVNALSFTKNPFTWWGRQVIV